MMCTRNFMVFLMSILEPQMRLLGRHHSHGSWKSMYFLLFVTHSFKPKQYIRSRQGHPLVVGIRQHNLSKIH
ncbi:hypothetical protein EYC80_003827 [Monilinia laxa]|uniref:Uncharacterized protein n=1 Tax=Monilinia laxa TaxID=61186 RepID=A0A5N6KL84_MONLA|nr:hypothetical protein EYC80_003827 [Monilinia laxa]